MEQRVRVVRGLVAAAAISIVLYVARVIFYGDFTFGYMIWNLVLAVIPFFIGVALIDRLQGRLWSEPANLALTLLWLGFLPNSFYVATDLIHIAEVTSRTIVFDAIMLLSFTIAGLLYGYGSVVMVHRELRKRHRKNRADLVVAIIFLACSYAIYLGRYMRWNTWDVIINPIGLISNILDSLVIPRDGAPMLETTALFFVFLGSFYLVALWLWPEVLHIKKTRHRN